MMGSFRLLRIIEVWAAARRASRFPGPTSSFLDAQRGPRECSSYLCDVLEKFASIRRDALGYLHTFTIDFKREKIFKLLLQWRVH